VEIFLNAFEWHQSKNGIVVSKGNDLERMQCYIYSRTKIRRRTVCIVIKRSPFCIENESVRVSKLFLAKHYIKIR